MGVKRPHREGWSRVYKTMVEGAGIASSKRRAHCCVSQTNWWPAEGGGADHTSPTRYKFGSELNCPDSE